MSTASARAGKSPVDRGLKTAVFTSGRFRISAFARTLAGAFLLASTRVFAESPVAFDPAAAPPWFATGPAAEASARFRVEDFAGAAKRFGDYLAAHPRAADRNEAAFMEALALSRAGRFLDAARRFDELSARFPLLADYERLYAAHAYLAARRFDEALDRAGQVERASPLGPDAELARADALAGKHLGAQAAAVYKAYSEAFPKSWREPEARLRFAEEEESLGEAGWLEARAVYRALYVHFPTEAAGMRAEKHLAARDPKALELSALEHLDRGLALFDAMRNGESEAELRAAVAAPGNSSLAVAAAGSVLDGKQLCVAAYHLAQSVFKERDRPRAAALFDEAALACARAPVDGETTDLHMKALYQGGRCHAARGEAELAAALFARAEAAHPTHSFADDARLRQAEVYDAIAQKIREGGAKPPVTDGGVAATAADYEGKANALLADLADLYPSGDLRGEALFRLFFRAWRAGQLDEAKRWLDTTLEKVPREEGWWEAGRTLYWQGRVAAKRGRGDEAKAFFSRCARDYPLSYYALQSLNRLRETWPDDEKKLVDELHRPEPTTADLAWQFSPRALFGEPGFRRGVELSRLGLGAEARRELAAVGIKPPEKGQKVAGAEAEELLWLATVLYDRAGEFALSHWIPRHTLTDYALAWPTGTNRRRWVLSYPRGFGELIVENAHKCGQPPALEFAIVREESAFDPLTESFANAVGLTQLTPPPAKRFAEGLPFGREALKDPAINVAIGARELGYLWNYYDHDAALVIAGYNAGEGAVNRWLRVAERGERGEAAADTLDAFIESIPYDETRGYTKRVLSSWFAYHWLYPDHAGEDAVPVLAPSLAKKK